MYLTPQEWMADPGAGLLIPPALLGLLIWGLWRIIRNEVRFRLWRNRMAREHDWQASRSDWASFR